MYFVFLRFFSPKLIIFQTYKTINKINILVSKIYFIASFVKIVLALPLFWLNTKLDLLPANV